MKKIALITLILLASTVYAQVPHPAPLDTIMDGEREITYFYYKNWEYICTVGHGYLWSATHHPIARKFHTDSLLRVCGLAICAAPLSEEDLARNRNYVPINEITTDSIIRLQIYEAGAGRLIPLADVPANVNTVSRWMQVYGYENYPSCGTGFIVPGGPHYNVYPVTEVYFDSTVTVNDSFYVGWSPGRSVSQDSYPLGFTMNILSWNVTSWLPTDQNGPCALWDNQVQKYASFDPTTQGWSYYTILLYEVWFIFPIIDSTGWYLYCDTMECPRIKDLNVSTGYGMAVCSWLGDTLDGHGEWQLSYGPVGTEPGGGRVITTEARSLVLSNLEDTVTYVAYVRGYCDECRKWGEWSFGVEFRLRDPEGVRPLEGLERSVQVMPNPTRGKVEVKSTVGLQRVTVYDGQGVQVLTRQVSGNATEIELVGCPSGMYYITVFTPAGTVCRKLVVE